MFFAGRPLCRTALPPDPSALNPPLRPEPPSPDLQNFAFFFFLPRPSCCYFQFPRSFVELRLPLRDDIIQNVFTTHIWALQILCVAKTFSMMTETTATQRKTSEIGKTKTKKGRERKKSAKFWPPPGPLPTRTAPARTSVFFLGTTNRSETPEQIKMYTLNVLRHFREIDLWLCCLFSPDVSTWTTGILHEKTTNGRGDRKQL